MKIAAVRSDGLAALSYYVSSKGESFVIDPRRDASIYGKLAGVHLSPIRYIFETHRNEDYVTGSLELQQIAPEAEICHSNATNFHFGDHSVADGEEFTVGDMLVRCISTPGHTDDSISYAVSDLSVGRDPLAVFTGDTLFVNEVGRTDLVDIKKHAEMSRKLYNSLHSKLLPMGDGVIVHPGHGAGSVCGGAIGEREFTTIGYERRNNKWLQLDEEEFVKAKLSQGLTRASYFKHCEHLNTIGPPLLAESGHSTELNSEDVEALLKDDGHRVVDTRPSDDFLREHIPGTISMTLSNMGLLAGWALSPSHTHSFVLAAQKDLPEATAYLQRIGFDRIHGFLVGGFEAWKASGRGTERLVMYNAKDIAEGLKNGALSLVDVREPHEFSKEHIPGSQSVPLTLAGASDIAGLPSGPIGTVCPSGARSTTAASILKRRGVESIGVYHDGLKTWKQEGRELVKED